MHVFTAIYIIVSISWISGEMMPGGLSEEEHKPVEKDDPVLAIVPKISDDIRSQVGAKLVSGDAQNSVKDAPISVIAYKTQLVAGMNYFVKAKIGKFVFLLRIYKPLPGQGEPSLSSVKGPIKESDEIEYFY